MIILASCSPRRHDLLKLITAEFEVLAANVDESVIKDASPRELVESLSLKKAEAVFKLRQNDAVIGADTIVALGETILGKPKDERDAAVMLRALSGKTHEVFTGVSIVANGLRHTFSEASKVTFLSLSEKEINDYISTGEPLDKAGAYGIQGKGALLVSGIDGDFYTVMGLPVARLNRELLALGVLRRTVF